MRKLSMYVTELPDGPKTKGFPFKHNDIMVMLGELEYMPGHCVVARQSDGRVFIGYHTDNFRKLTEDDV